MIRVLIVDDSSFMRKSISYMLKTDPALEVAGTADNGAEALKKVKEIRPDVVLLDIAMPMMDGLEALRHIMAECPTPVLILSGIEQTDISVAVQSLGLGAVDYIQKPSGVISYNIDTIRDEIVTKVHMAARARVNTLDPHHPKSADATRKGKIKFPKRIVVIGASTGGPKAAAVILSRIPSSISAGIVVVQHMSKVFTPFWAGQLNEESSLNVFEAKDHDLIGPGCVLIAPGGFQTGIERDGRNERIFLRKGKDDLQSIDYTMDFAAQIYGAGVVGVLLTGMGSDGAKGLKAIKDAGGSTIAEAESTCVVFGMPKAAIELGCVDEVTPLPGIARSIMKMM